MLASTLQDKIMIGTLHPVAGFMVSGVACGLRKSGRRDLALIASEVDCTMAGVFTTNHVKAAPVLLNMERLQTNPTRIRAIVTNAANANACTGEQGMQNAYRTAELVGQALHIDPEQVLVQSTGVIGVQLPMDLIEKGVQLASQTLEMDGWEDAANAIMTTDTRPKAVSKICNGYTITAMAKGSGMIAPNMATMLAMLSTDAQVAQPLLQKALQEANQVSFNRICVDGDTSTNDTVLLLANGLSGTVIEEGYNYDQFVADLTEVATELAHHIVRDGEGATKFITIHVSGAPDNTSAHQIANTIATSPLVKTAFYGNDANWGRIIAAAGRAGTWLDQTRLNLWFSADGGLSEPLQVVSEGTPTSYLEAKAAAIFAQAEIIIHLDIGLGEGEATVWTCDLSHGYVSINADYRT